MKKVIMLIGFLLIYYCGYTQDKVDPNGYNIFYYPNEKKSSEGWMKNGKPDGFWINYYVTGVKKSEGIRRNNLLDSIWVFYNIYGDTIKKINYLYGMKNGYSYEYTYDNIERKQIMIVKELFVNNKKEGTSKYYYDNGNLWEIVNYKEGLLEGEKLIYAEDRRLISRSSFKAGRLIEREIINQYEDDLKSGIWKEFYEDGLIKNEMFYIRDTLHGIYKKFDRNGIIKSIVKYDMGRLVDRNVEDEAAGLETKTIVDNNGNIVYKGTYKNDVPVGLHREFDSIGNVINAFQYNENGNKISEGIVTLNGIKTGYWEYYYDDGTIQSKGNYRSNSKSGKWYYYYRNSKIEQVGHYKNGLPDGQWKWYYKNGNVLREENYLNGMNDGFYVEYDKSENEIAKGEFLEDIKEGKWFSFVGDHKEVGDYIRGLRDGEWNYYYKDGALMFKGIFIQGNPDGKHYYFYPNGNVKEERNYLMGYKEKTWKRYDEYGNIYMTITYESNKEVKINGVKIKEE